MRWETVTTRISPSKLAVTGKGGGYMHAKHTHTTRISPSKLAVTGNDDDDHSNNNNNNDN